MCGKLVRQQNGSYKLGLSHIVTRPWCYLSPREQVMMTRASRRCIYILPLPPPPETLLSPIYLQQRGPLGVSTQILPLSISVPPGRLARGGSAPSARGALVAGRRSGNFRTQRG